MFLNFPYGGNTHAMKTLSIIVFFLNLAIFIFLSIVSLARYLIFPNIWGMMTNHPLQSMYLATIPMGACTLINVGVNLIYKEYGFGGTRFLYALWGLWWLDVAVSAVVCWGLFQLMSVYSFLALKLSLTTLI